MSMPSISAKLGVGLLLVVAYALTVSRMLWPFLLSVAAASAYANPLATSSRPLIVAVVPQFTALQIHKDWTPFLERVSLDSGVLLVLKTYQNIPAFEADVLKGVPDLAFMNPYHAVMAKHAAGYLPLVRDTKLLTGLLLVRRDSLVRSIKDLSDAKIAFPSPNAFGASLYMRALLAEKGGIKIEPNYVETHSNVLRNVILGKVVAGGTVESAFQRESVAVIEQLRVIYETPGFAPHPLVVHPRVTAKQRKAVTSAILRLNDDASSATLLRAVQMAKPLAADYARDYRPLELLKLEKHLVLEKE